MGAAERTLPGVVHQVVFAAAAAALLRRQADVRDHHLLALEPRQRHVDAADRHFALGAILDLAADGGAVRTVPEPQQGEQDQLLELSQHRGVVVLDVYPCRRSYLARFISITI